MSRGCLGVSGSLVSLSCMWVTFFSASSLAICKGAPRRDDWNKLEDFSNNLSLSVIFLVPFLSFPSFVPRLPLPRPLSFLSLSQSVSSTAVHLFHFSAFSGYLHLSFLPPSLPSFTVSLDSSLLSLFSQTVFSTSDQLIPLLNHPCLHLSSSPPSFLSLSLSSPLLSLFLNPSLLLPFTLLHLSAFSTSLFSSSLPSLFVYLQSYLLSLPFTIRFFYNR